MRWCLCSSPEGGVALKQQGFVSLSGKVEDQAESKSGPGLSGANVLSPEQAGGLVSKKGCYPARAACRGLFILPFHCIRGEYKVIQTKEEFCPYSNP